MESSLLQKLRWLYQPVGRGDAENTATIPIGHTSVDIAGGFVLFSPDGTMLATGSDYVKLGHIIGSVKLWDAVTKENIATFEEHESQIISGRFRPMGHCWQPARFTAL